MAQASSSDLKFEIGHVLFIDIVGYSKLLISEQSEQLQKLKEIVWGTEQFRQAQAESKLLRLPTGDGGALVFRTDPEAPVLCAMEISKGLKQYPEIRVRMGVHSGPVNEITDLNAQANIAGAGINIAQRVMDCGDAGHILLSRHVAEDLEQYPRWRSYLHDLGECEVKHGVRIHAVNLYTDEVGNLEVPEKFRQTKATQPAPTITVSRRLFAALIIVAALAVTGFYIISHRPVSSAPFSATAVVPIAIPEKSIAVLPFENLSRDPDNAFFTDGVQDEILTYLAKIADLKVTSRSSVMQYKSGIARNVHQIGTALGVAHLLEGSIQRALGKVRVNAQLIDARTDAHLWAQTYDRDIADIFVIQSEIAKAIADQLQAKLSPVEKAMLEKPPTTDAVAYDIYLRAQLLYYNTTTDAFQAKQKLPEAARLLDEAVARDSHFLQALCLLSKVHTTLYFLGYDHTPARLKLADMAVQAALLLQPDSGEAHLALADYFYRGFRDYGRARTELAIASRTLPNDAKVFEYTGYTDRRQGHWEEATRSLERATELDPRNFLILQQLALTYQQQRRYEEEARIYDRALTIVPGDPETRIFRAVIPLNEKADIKPFQIILSALVAEDPNVATDVDDPIYALCERTASASARALANYPRDGEVYYGVNFPKSYWEGVVARWQGDSAKARAAFSAARDEVVKDVQSQPDFAAAISLLGMIDAGLGRKGEALSEGRRACELLPPSKDAFDGPALAANLAQIYAWTGEKDLAIDQIDAVERIPNFLSYGFLKLRPEWDSLRNEPRFEQLVDSLAAKN